MGVSTGQVFQPRIMSVVEPQRRESAWEQILPSLISSVAQTAVNSYVKNKLTEGQQDKELLAKGYTKNPDGSWNPPAGWISESAVPGVLQYGQGSATTGFMASPKSGQLTSLDALETAIANQRIANGEDPDKVAAEYRQRRKEQPLNIQGGLQIPGTDQTGPMQMVRQPDGSVMAKPVKVDMSEFANLSQGTTKTGGSWGLQPQAGAAPTQPKQTISPNVFSPTTRATPAAISSTEAPVAPVQPVAPVTSTPVMPAPASTTAQVVGQVAPQYAVSAPKKTDVAKPSFEQDLAIKSWAAKNNLDPNTLTAPQKQEALMEVASDKVKAQEEMKRAGIDVPTLAAQVRKGTLSTNAKAIMGASGSRAAVRPMIAGEVMRQIAEENARADGMDWNKLTKEQQQSYKNNAYFDFDKMEANYAWETSPIRTKNITFIDGITPRVKALELKANQLPNTNFKSANELQKWFKTQIGDKAYTDYESLLTQVVQEANTALSGSATGSDLRINLEMQNLNSALSPAQLKAGLNNLNSALLARREALSKDVVPMPIVLGKATDHEWATALNDFYNRQAERIVGDYKDHTDIRHPSDETVMKIIAENRKSAASPASSAPAPTASPASSGAAVKPMSIYDFYQIWVETNPQEAATKEGQSEVWQKWLRYRDKYGIK